MWGVKTPSEAKAKIDEQRGDDIERMRKAGIYEARNLEE